MNSLYNFDTLLQYLYSETNTLQTIAIKQEIANNAKCNAEFQELKSSMECLPAPACMPNADVVNKILNYSKWD